MDGQGWIQRAEMSVKVFGSAWRASNGCEGPEMDIEGVDGYEWPRMGVDDLR